jgi:hypothetical protein
MKMRATERLYELWNLPALAVERSQFAIWKYAFLAPFKSLAKILY